MNVTALLVSHDGASWLPAVLAGLRDSTRQPDATVAVDTGSSDASVDLVREALGVEPVALAADATWAAAVRAGLAALPPLQPDEWVWLLHDDAAPTPECLEILASAAEETGPDGEYAVIGPKLREWPSLRRLLEVGVTISGTGRRETGLEPGEYDQGQHDTIHPVLAVNTAGMLVRRDVLEQVGFDDRLPFLGTDLDFGWRAALAGHRTVVVPDAVLHHVEAGHRGRRSGLRDPRGAERAGAISTLLANGSAAMLPWRALRLFVGGLLRMLGFLLVRAVPEATGELRALASVYLRPHRIWAMRRARRGTRTVPRSEVRPLLSPWWVPYRHGLDFFSDVLAALVDVGRDTAGRRDEHGHSLARRLVTSPAPWVALVLAVLALVANHDLLGGAPLHGGALLRPPDGVGQWWSLWSHGWHPLGTGTTAPAPPYVLVLAVLGTLLLGSATGLVSIIFVLVTPLAMLSAYRFTRRVMPGRWAPTWAAVAYAVLPVVSGAVAQGRIGTVAASVVLPFVATSALGLAAEDPDRRERAVWRTALGAGVLVAFVPPAEFLLVLLTPFAAYLTGRPQDWRRLVAIPAIPLLFALPWLLGTLTQPDAWLLEAGRASAAGVAPDLLHLLTGRAGGAGQAPWWFAIGVPLAALVALVRTDTRRAVSRAWLVTAVAAVLLLGVSWARADLPGLAGPVRPYAGFLVLVVQAGMLTAAGVAAAGAVRIATDASFGWRQVVGGLAFVGAVAAPLVGLGWWVTAGSDGPLNAGPAATLPAYMTEVSATSDTGGVLVLRGGGETTDVRYRVLRDGTLRLGEEGVLALTPENRTLTTSLGELLAGSQAPVAHRLASYGVAWVYAPAPVSGAVSGALDAADGFSGASAPVDGTRAWKVEERPTALADEATPLHLLAIVLQVIAIIAVVVLAAPSRRRRIR